jgi:hypothetical protein
MSTVLSTPLLRPWSEPALLAPIASRRQRLLLKRRLGQIAWI